MAQHGDVYMAMTFRHTLLHLTCLPLHSQGAAYTVIESDSISTQTSHLSNDTLRCSCPGRSFTTFINTCSGYASITIDSCCAVKAGIPFFLYYVYRLCSPHFMLASPLS
ncbi:hypothetical protein E2C01_023048 [Portunus trituberculatus]|uniref:Uncharacterized protein n=1 Tax=Portunus trituberculatus TaxID=210409 RepID=A0A5B7E7T6_PORTR|nr:hypothetical protein [Portunus trituberculatus]